MCRPDAVVCCSTLAWRVGAPVPRVGRRAEPARTLLAGFTLSALGRALGFTLFVMHWHGEPW
jgi:hypothetical protein